MLLEDYLPVTNNQAGWHTSSLPKPPITRKLPPVFKNPNRDPGPVGDSSDISIPVNIPVSPSLIRDNFGRYLGFRKEEDR